MRKIIFILLLFVALSGYSQKHYIPWLQTDDTHVLSNFVLNGDTFRITGPANGQIIQRVSGKWINVPSPASVFDSLVWNPATGDLVSWKDGSPFTTENLDGRYAVNDGNIGDMLKAIYDTAMISEQVVGLTASQTLSNKILILPTIANFTNAQHNHSSAATGGLISSDNITQGTINFFSRWGKNANTIYYNTGSVAIGKTTAGSALDVVGTTTTQGLNVTSTITFDGLTITDIQPGSTDNNHLVTKGYVDDLGFSGGSSDTTWSRTSGRLYPRYTTDEVSIGSATDYGDYSFQVDGSTVYRLRNSTNFRNIDLITGTTTTPLYRISADASSGLLISKWGGSSFSSLLGFPYTGNYISVSGGIQLSNTTTEAAGLIRWDGTNFQGYTGTAWINLDQAGGGSSYWTGSTGYVAPATITDEVRIGATTDNGDYKLQVTGDSYFSGSSRLGSFAELYGIAAPASPASGYGRLYAKTDGKVYFKNSSGTEYDLTAAGGTSQWTNDTYGIYYTNNVGIGSLGASGSSVALDVYKSISGGYTGQFTNPSSSGNGIASHIGSTSDSYTISRYMSSNTERISVTGGGALKIIERASPGTPTSGYGYLYAKTDNKLYFKNDAGTEYDLTSSGGGTTLWQEDGNYLKPYNTLRNVMVTNAQPSLRFVDSDYSTRNFSIDFITDQLRFSYYNGTTYYDQYINQFGFYGGQLRLFASSYQDLDGVIRYDGADLLGRVGGVWKSLTATGGGSGTVTSVAAGNGMNFTTITTTGTVTLGTPSSITTSTTNSASSGTHTHTLDLSGRSVLTSNSLTGGGNLGSNLTLQLVNDAASPGNNKVYGTNGSGTRGWQQSQNISVQLLSGTSVVWNINNGINGRITLSDDTSITLTNLVAGQTGNLTVINAPLTYTLTFAGSYTYKISPFVYRATSSPLTSGSSKIDVFSWYYDGVTVFINGTNDYK